MSLCYIWCKQCTYLASRLALSSNGLKQTSTWATSPRSTIRCVQKWFMSLWYVWRKWCTYLEPTLTLSPNRPKRDSTWPTSPRSSIRCIQTISEPMVRSTQTELSFRLCLVTKNYHRVRPKWFLSLWYVWRKSCTYLAPTLTLSPNGWKQDSTWPTSPGDPSGASKLISKFMVHLTENVHLSCVKISTISKRTESSFHLSLFTY
jgi:hypothetical protein